MVFMSELIRSGKVAPVIDRQYRLSEALEALQFLWVRGVRGKLVITVSRAID